MSRNYSSTAVDTTLSSGVSPANTSITVASTTGFPAAPFVLALGAGTATQELVLVTAVGGSTLTVTRGYDSTVANTHDAGVAVSHSHAAIDFREAGATKDAYDAHAAATAAHGATGAVVGTTNTQTLTNKTLTSPTINGTTGIGGAYGTHSPTITSGGGSFTSVSGATRYTQVGKTVYFSTKITITTVGTATGAVFFTLPVTSQSADANLGAGRSNISGKGLTVSASSTTLGVVYHADFTSAIAAGSLVVSGSYEAA